MKSEKITISEAELEIMKVLWKQGVPVNTQSINREVGHKGWKRTTISTLLARLVEKGAVSGEKEGNTYYYLPLISAGEYRRAQTKNFIRNLYGGSAKELAVSLFEDNRLSDEDIRDLKKMFQL